MLICGLGFDPVYSRHWQPALRPSVVGLPTTLPRCLRLFRIRKCRLSIAINWAGGRFRFLGCRMHARGWAGPTQSTSGVVFYTIYVPARLSVCILRAIPSRQFETSKKVHIFNHLFRWSADHSISKGVTSDLAATQPVLQGNVRQLLAL